MPTLVCTTCWLVQPCACMWGRARPRTLTDIAHDDAAHVARATAACRQLQAEEGATHAGQPRPVIDPELRRSILAAYARHPNATAVARLLGLPARSVLRVVQRAAIDSLITPDVPKEAA